MNQSSEVMASRTAKDPFFLSDGGILSSEKERMRQIRNLKIVGKKKAIESFTPPIIERRRRRDGGEERILNPILVDYQTPPLDQARQLGIIMRETEGISSHYQGKGFAWIYEVRKKEMLSKSPSHAMQFVARGRRCVNIQEGLALVRELVFLKLERLTHSAYQESGGLHDESKFQEELKGALDSLRGITSGQHMKEPVLCINGVQFPKPSVDILGNFIDFPASCIRVRGFVKVPGIVHAKNELRIQWCNEKDSSLETSPATCGERLGGIS